MLTPQWEAKIRLKTEEKLKYRQGQGALKWQWKAKAEYDAAIDS
jgi:hypothetical protein